jgi:hypothetical protein
MYNWFSKENCLQMPFELSKGTYIWVIHADKKPPHVGISASNLYFSLKIGGKDESIPDKEVLKIITKKNIPTIIVELSDEVDVSSVKELFSQYKSIDRSFQTCLTPIAQLLENSNQIFLINDLLQKYHSKNKIKSYIGIRLPENFTGIPLYTKETIQNRLKELEDAKR